MKQEKILHYYAVFEPAKEGGYNVLFPSFSGCVTFGRTFEGAKEKAQEILELWLEELRTENQKIPLASEYPVIYKVPVRLSIKKSAKSHALLKR